MKDRTSSSVNREVRRRTQQSSPFVEGQSSTGEGSSSRPRSDKVRRTQSPSMVSPEEEYSQIPWLDMLPRGRQYDGIEHRLHHEILAYVNYMEATPKEKKTREAVLSCIRRVVNNRFRNAQINVFGSCATGLSLPNSDIDVVVTAANIPDVKDALFKLSSKLKYSGLTNTKIFVNHRAQVPILTLTTSEEYGSFNVDIGINNNLGIEAIDLIKGYLSRMPALRPLLLVLKGFLRQRNLNDASRGGLGSYALTCLCISFLQVNPRKRPQEFIDKPMETESLGALLTDFMFYYGFEFPYTTSYISVSEGKVLPKSEPMESLSIKCPIRPDYDISKSVSKLDPFLRAFKEGYATILQFTVVDESMLGQLVRLSLQTVQRRSFISSLPTLRSSVPLSTNRPYPPSGSTPRAPRIRNQSYDPRRSDITRASPMALKY
ncbi:Non-canonical poly(A) RNA polymerase PAPD5 [Hypsizygus marmoreus]|uniref:polynucleotide adenylyltransferase n=1 Tax=Hypsizygus marmoreus TaxID=39966 RepID=A0A369JYB2_HYPMA|nr:Non-canonical poly(A) RNA polymerase PAPD5 [Hypsizygus marmoreus]